MTDHQLHLDMTADDMHAIWNYVTDDARTPAETRDNVGWLNWLCCHQTRDKNFYAALLEQLRGYGPDTLPPTTPQPQPPAVPTSIHTTPQVVMPQDGAYTIGSGDHDYVTLQIRPVVFGSFPEGTKQVSYLAGPDNEADFVGFAFIKPTGRISIWSKKQGRVDRQEAALRQLLSSSDRTQFGYEYALRSGRCWRCGKRLTVPASINRGLGPTCASYVAEGV